MSGWSQLLRNDSEPFRRSLVILIIGQKHHCAESTSSPGEAPVKGINVQFWTDIPPQAVAGVSTQTLAVTPG
jgi:hypothetical protein